jgi:hypothetical protein
MSVSRALSGAVDLLRRRGYAELVCTFAINDIRANPGTNCRRRRSGRFAALFCRATNPKRRSGCARGLALRDLLSRRFEEWPRPYSQPDGCDWQISRVSSADELMREIESEASNEGLTHPLTGASPESCARSTARQASEG